VPSSGAWPSNQPSDPRSLTARSWAQTAPRTALLILALSATAPAAARAETASLHASFSPNRLGASTTIGFSFGLQASGGGIPAPLSAISLRLPPGINYLSTTLGLAICQPAALQARGPSGCPPNSRLGSGSALVEVPFGVGSGKEIPEIQAVMGPPANENIVVLFYANGLAPVVAQIVMQAELVAGTDTSAGRLDTQVPLIASIAGGPPVSILSVTARIGPAGLTYYENRHGRRVAFHPRGVSVPQRCPRGGFRFSARFSFTDATSTSAAYSVPCPPRHT
jgi:hypothetical protein